MGGVLLACAVSVFGLQRYAPRHARSRSIMIKCAVLQCVGVLDGLHVAVVVHVVLVVVKVEM
eukprot:1875587-Rhodomonas_salina.1